MATTFTPEKIGTLVGILILVAVPAFVLYQIFVVAKVDAATPVSKVAASTGLAVLEYRDKDPNSTQPYAENVFVRMQQVNAPSAPSTGAPYNPGELGNSTLGQ